VVGSPQSGATTIVLCTIVGASMLWAKIGRQKLRPYLFAELVDLLPLDLKFRRAIEFMIFIAVGTFIGIVVAVPTNPQQAITAGFAWTSVFSLAGEKKKRDGSGRT
jgi:hypothetical protein